MENDVPTNLGPTPDSEENNNSSAKTSPGPSTVISERADTGLSTNDPSDGAKTPLSAVSDGVIENAGDVTIESQPPEDKTTPSGTPVDKGDHSQDGEATGEKQETDGKDEQKKDSGLGEETVRLEDTGNGNDKVEIGQPKEEVGVEEGKQSVDSAVDGQVIVVQESSEKADGGKDNEDHTVQQKEYQAGTDVDAGNDESIGKSGSADGTVEDDNSKEHKEQLDAGDIISPSVNVEEGSKEEVDAEPVGSSVNNGEANTEDGYLGDNETPTMQSVDPSQTSNAVSGGDGDNPGPDGTGDSEIITKGDVVDVGDVAEETPLSHEELLTKYHATELQLDGMREENAKLNARIEELEKEVRHLRDGEGEAANEKQRDGYRVHADFLARELSQTQDAEQFLKEKVAELLEQNEEGEKKIKDLQLRLKRFAKDDKAKDERIAKMEAELKEITGVVEELESYVDEGTRSKIEERRSRQSRPTMSAPAASDTNHTKNTDISKMNTNRSYRDPGPVVRSRTCVMF